MSELPLPDPAELKAHGSTVSIMIMGGQSRDSVIKHLEKKGMANARAMVLADSVFAKVSKIFTLEAPSTRDLAVALVAGTVSMIVGAVWWDYLFLMNLENRWSLVLQPWGLGVAAFIMALIAGVIVKISAGWKRSRQLQIIAAAASAGLIVLAKGGLWFMAWLVNSDKITSWTMVVNGFDLVWLIGAALISWRMLKPSGMGFTPGPGWERILPFARME